MQAQYERRFTKGLQFLGAFTWSKAIDDSCGDAILAARSSIRTIRSSGPFEHRPELHHGPQLAVRVPIGRGKRWAAIGRVPWIGRSVAGSSRQSTPCCPASPSACVGWKPRKLCYARRSNRQGRRKSWKPIELHHRSFTVPASTGGVFNAPVPRGATFCAVRAAPTWTSPSSRSSRSRRLLRRRSEPKLIT